MEKLKFKEFRNLVLNSFKSVDLSVKIFGGVAVSLYSKERGTLDIDMAIKKNLEDVSKLIVALESIEFSTQERILEDIFGADPHEELFLFAMCRLTSDNPKFSDYHIDLCFEFGNHSYDTLEAEEVELDGVKTLVVTLPQLVAMKKKINPPRPQDIKDLETLTPLLAKQTMTDMKPSSIFDKRGGE